MYILYFSLVLYCLDYLSSFICLVADLGETSSMLMSAGLKPNTHRTYNSAQQRYLSFCEHYQLVGLPATEDVLLLYVAFLYDQGLKGSSIRVYLAAVRSLHVYSNMIYPQDSLRLKLAVKGAVSQSAPPSREISNYYRCTCEDACSYC